jgi:hypothetical protein
MCLQANLLKEINRVADSFNICVQKSIQIEKEKESLSDNLSFLRNKLKSECNIDCTITFKDSVLKIEIHNP